MGKKEMSDKMSEWICGCVGGLNQIQDHVWAAGFILVGVLLVCAGHKDTGELIVGAGLAIFRVPSKS